MNYKKSTEYMDYLKRIGRQCDFNNSDDNESNKMTEAEKLLLISMLLNEDVISIEYLNFDQKEIIRLLTEGDDYEKIFIKKIKETVFKLYENKMQQIYKKYRGENHDH